MADNKNIRDGDNSNFVGALDELSDGSFAPKHQLLDGSTSPAPISPATSGKQDTGNTSLDSILTKLNSSVAVTGTFWQATQPVSGIFWQATQPVSGTFWQATQPVSVASMPSTPVTGPITDAQLRAVPVPVSIGATLTIDSELAAASLASDAAANPTAPFIQSAPSLFNGTTWDRWRGTTNGAYVQGNVASGAADAGNPQKLGGVFNTTQPTVTNGQRVDAQMTARGAQIVAPGVDGFAVSIAAGTATIAKAEDVASADADVGVPAMAVRKATPANTSGTDGDYEFLQISAGRVWVSATIDATTGTPVEATITAGGTAQLLFSATPTNGYEVINTHATETLYIREGNTATAAGNSFNIPILPNSSYTTPVGYKPTGDVSIIAATTGHAVIGRRW